MNALRQARDVLLSAPYPLVIFPEGEVYHLNHWVMPFREGPATIALLAAKKAERPIVCVPAAIKYRYVEDPTPRLEELMGRLERAVFWRPRPDLTLPQRIYHLAEGALALKEVEYLGSTHSGPLPERILRLVEFVLGRIEARWNLPAEGATVPDRVKAVRRMAIEHLVSLPRTIAAGPSSKRTRRRLLRRATVQPPRQLRGRRALRRTHRRDARQVRGGYPRCRTASTRARRATVTFGRPIPVPAGKGAKPIPRSSRGSWKNPSRRCSTSAPNRKKAAQKPWLHRRRPPENRGRFMYRLFWTIVRWMLDRRYRVEITGLEQLEGLDGPTLVMPSHPAYIDPPLVISHLRLRRSLRPIVYAGIYRIPLLRPLMRLVDALEVPDLAEHSRAARERPWR